jgi:hypothetical protein
VCGGIGGGDGIQGLAHASPVHFAQVIFKIGSHELFAQVTSNLHLPHITFQVGLQA